MNSHNISFVSTGDPTTDTFPDIQTGGSGPIWRLSKEFASRGHNVTIYSGTYNERTRREEEGIEIVELPTPNVGNFFDEGLTRAPLAKTLFNLDSVSASPGKAIERLFGRLVFSLRAAKDIKCKNPDVVYLRDRVSGYFPARMDIPTIHTVKSPDACDFFYQRSVSRHTANRILFYYRQFLEEQVVGNADCTLVMNQWMKEYFETKKFSNISVVSLGINEEDIIQNPLTDRNNWILYVGRFDGNKRPEWILEAYDQASLTDMEIHYIGTGQRESYIRDAVDQRGLNDSVVFHGRIPRSEVLKYMRRSKVFVLPSEFENCPNVIVEAMGSGCPPIASSTYGARHLISHEKTGIIFDKHNKRDLQRQLEKCLSNEKLRQKLSKNAVEYIRHNHTVKTVADQYWNAYEQAR